MHRLQRKHDKDGRGSEGRGQGGMGRAREGWVITCNNSLKTMRSSDNYIHPLDRFELIFCGKGVIEVCFLLEG